MVYLGHMGETRQGTMDHLQDTRILVVDSDSSSRGRLVVGLSQDRYPIFSSAGPESGLYCLGRLLPGLIVLRLNPEQSDGLTRRFREASTAPLIVLADDQDQQVHVENLTQGADFVLPSSVSIRELRSRVRVLVWRSQTPG